MINKNKLKIELDKLVKQANFSLRSDVDKLLRHALRQEKKYQAKKALQWILENAVIAGRENIAICQDTGLPIVFIEVGDNVMLSAADINFIQDIIEQSYADNYLRPSIVSPLNRGVSSYKGIILHTEFIASVKGLRISIFPKGFGSENKSQIKMFNPTASLEDIENFIINCVKSAGPEACPPFIVGVGIGGTADSALTLAKKVLIDRVDKQNHNNVLNGMEKRLLKRINALNIGPMGLGGKTTALAVKIKEQRTHIAGLPVGVNISCHALRSATVTIAG